MMEERDYWHCGQCDYKVSRYKNEDTFLNEIEDHSAGHESGRWEE